MKTKDLTKDLSTVEFRPLEDANGRKWLRTENNTHYYEKVITKGSGNSKIQTTATLITPANIHAFDNLEALQSFASAAQRQIIADQSNYIRQNDLITEEDRQKKTQAMKSKFADLLSGLSEEDRAKILSELKA